MGMVRKTMDADTLSALRHSITKWEMIIAGAGADDGGLNCALCRKFFDHPNFCEGCPVKTRTRLKGCSGSPYDDWACHHEREHSDGDDCCPLTIECGECHRLAETQLDFLRGLLPREHATGGSPAAALFHWWIKRGSEIILDFLHGVDTAPGASSGERAHAGIRGAHAYDPAPWWTLKRSMRLASIRAEGFTFVDIGCGKGRVLLSALALPFSRVIGIELSRALSKIAEKNLTSARLIARRCSSAQVIRGDATEFSMPHGPNVVFFYNPFPLDTMEIVLGNIVRSYLDAPRPVFLIFYACSSIMPRIREFLPARTNGCARPRVSTTIGYRSVTVFELPQAQHI
jgi:SAM-dependent methyltransferase